MRNSIATFIVATAITVSITAYVSEQVLLNAEAHKNKPVSYMVVYEPKEIEPELESLGEFTLTAYCSCETCCDGWAKNRPTDQNGNEIVIGASGEVLEAGRSIAVDPTVIPYGTSVYINGKEYIAEDCGGAIKQKRIDVYFDNHKDALEFGVQYAELFIRRENENGS